MAYSRGARLSDTGGIVTEQEAAESLDGFQFPMDGMEDLIDGANCQNGPGLQKRGFLLSVLYHLHTCRAIVFSEDILFFSSCKVLVAWATFALTEERTMTRTIARLPTWLTLLLFRNGNLVFLL